MNKIKTIGMTICKIKNIFCIYFTAFTLLYLGTAKPKSQTSKEVQKRLAKPGMINSGKIASTIKTIPISITKLKRPKVKIRNGKVIKEIIGLIKKFRRPNTKPERNKILNHPEP